MAQNKYDLLLVPKKSNQTIREQPWYKERLQTKYLKQKKRGESSETLIGRNWVLLRPGIDDFRDGKPPEFDGKFVVEGTKGISPVLSRSKDSLSRRGNTGERPPRAELSKSQACFDRRLPLQRKRADHIGEVEFGLTQHPLALYPHLEEGMPPELFEEIVDLLDPAMNPDLESEVDESSSVTDRRTTTDPSLIRSFQEGINLPESFFPKQRNPYKWILRKDSGPRDEKKGARKRPTSPSQDEHIKKVTKEFCDWVADLGGGSNNVEESTIMSLFASGYETKPALSVPIHVVELSSVPPELRVSAGISPRASAKKSRPPSAVDSAAAPPPYSPSWVKVKYGAWYLPPATWRQRGADEPLENPAEVARRSMSESKKKSDEMDAQLAPLHGARAFREFLESNNKRKPEFMTKVADLQNLEDAETTQPNQSPQRAHSRATTRVRSGMTVRSDSSSYFR